MQQPDNALHNIINYYNRYDEQNRFTAVLGQVEYARTKGIICRHVKNPPAVVLDVGDAAGWYACWLAREGYEVHLVDPVPLHVQQAQAASAAQPKTPLARCKRGNWNLRTCPLMQFCSWALSITWFKPKIGIRLS